MLADGLRTNEARVKDFESSSLSQTRITFFAVGTSQNFQSFCCEADLALGFLLDVFLVFVSVCKKYALISLIPIPVCLWILLWQYVAKVLMLIKTWLRYGQEIVRSCSTCECSYCGACLLV